MKGIWAKPLVAKLQTFVAMDSSEEVELANFRLNNIDDLLNKFFDVLFDRISQMAYSCIHVQMYTDKEK